MLQKILVPLDGSSLGELSLNYAAELARSMNSELHLVSVCDRISKEYRNICSVYVGKMSEGLRSFKRGKTALPQVRTAVIDGQPDVKILDYAAENKIDLIILVSHGHSGIMPWATGSTANKIIQKSSIPVLLIRASDNIDTKQVPGLFKKILVPLDGSAMSEAVLPYVKEIAAHSGSEIILLDVLEHGQHVRTIGGIDYFEYSDEQVEAMRLEIIAYLDRINGQLVKDGFTVKSIVKKGDIAREIIDTIIQEDVNLVAMSSHGKSAATKWVLGSVSQKILQTGKKPLLLVRPS
jgi:nucleotide-binding universal stress UspA family protein